MEPRTLTSSVAIAAAADKVWKVIADDFTDVAAWGPGVKSSGPNPATPDGLNGSRHGGRVCDVEGLGATREHLVAYDDPARTLTYTVEADNLPPFIERLENTWTVSADDGTDSCTVDTEIAVTFDDSISEEDADNLVSTMFSGAGGAATNLKTYAESDN